MVSSEEKLSKGLLTAQQMMEKLALAEAQKAAEAERRRAAAEAEKKALIDKLSKPPDITEEERIKRAAAIIERAVANGMTEVQVMRFPNSLCTDHGRAINQGEPGWERTLTGLPKEMYEFWYRQLRPLGYKVHATGRHRYHAEMGVDWSAMTRRGEAFDYELSSRIREGSEYQCSARPPRMTQCADHVLEISQYDARQTAVLLSYAGRSRGAQCHTAEKP